MMRKQTVSHRVRGKSGHAAAVLMGVSISLTLLLVLLLFTSVIAAQIAVLTLVTVAASATCRLAALRADDARVRAGWNWFGLAMAFLALSFLCNAPSGEQITTSVTNLSGIGRIFKLLAYASSVAGLAFAVRVPREMLTRLFFDTGVVLAGSAVIIAMVLHRTAIQVSDSDLTNPVLYRPLVDVILLSLTMVALASLPRRARLYPSLIYGVISLACLFIGHMAATVAALQGMDVAPGWAYMLYGAAGLFIAAAAHHYVCRQWETDTPARVALEAHNPLTHSFWFHLGGAIVPYTVAMSAATLLVTVGLGSENSGPGTRLAWVGALAFVLAGGLRHILSHTETRNLYLGMSRLNRDLEKLVDQRTAELVRRNEKLEAVHQVALVSAESLDLPTILRAVAEQLSQAVGASYCAIYERTPEATRQIARFDRNNPLGTSRLRPPESNLLAVSPNVFTCVGHRTSVIHRWEQEIGTEGAEVLDANGAAVAMLVPLMAGEQTIGVAEIYRASPDPFSDDEVFLAEAIATQAALVTENARAYDNARFAANHDPVTGLLNHRALHEELARMFDRAVQSGSPMTVLMMDLNLFKEFNDHYGHQAGDRVLEDIGKAIKRSMPTTAAVARYGGDEFTAVIPDSPRENAQIFMSAIRERVDQIQDQHGFVGDGFGVSIGMASYPEDGTNLAEIVDRADHEMYQDKWRIKGYVDRRRSADSRLIGAHAGMEISTEPNL